jgi:DNA replication protein DnaC
MSFEAPPGDDTPEMNYFAVRARELKEWTQSNPEMARAWDSATEEDDLRKRDAAVRRFTPKLLTVVGVHPKTVDQVRRERRLRQTLALAAAYDFLTMGATFLVLLGAPGTGKSVAAAVALANLLRPKMWDPDFYITSDESNLPAWHVSASELSRTTSSEYAEGDRSRFQRASEVKYLVLDDLGVERASASWLARFDELLDRRYGSDLRTVITSNLDPERLKAQYGGRVSDRLRHEGFIVSTGSESLRKPRGSQP